MSEIKLAIVDDHDLFREGLKMVLSSIPGYKIVFEASDGETFLEKLKDQTADLVLMDINMPGMDGIEATKQALERFPALKVIALTMFSEQIYYHRMIDAGALGFIPKNAQKFELEKAITAVSAGEKYVSHEIGRQLRIKTAEKNDKSPFTSREFEVFELICRGLTTQETASALSISSKTVEVHRSSIFQKTRVRNIAELIIWAIKSGLLQFD